MNIKILPKEFFKLVMVLVYRYTFKRPRNKMSVCEKPQNKTKQKHIPIPPSLCSPVLEAILPSAESSSRVIQLSGPRRKMLVTLFIRAESNGKGQREYKWSER